MAELVTILIDGLTYASWLFIVALLFKTPHTMDGR